MIHSCEKKPSIWQAMAGRAKSTSGGGRRSVSSKIGQPSALESEQGFWRSTAQTLFAIDPRSLALFRIAMSLFLLFDLYVRATDLQAMYTDDGMFPRAMIKDFYPSAWNWSIHFLSGTATYEALLFAIAAAFAVALLIGYKTHWAVIGSWFLLVSLHNRVPPILNGSDNLAAVLMFWAMFLPLGRAWSVDGKLEKRRSNVIRQSLDPVLSVASAAILLQMAMMYFFSAIFKTNTDWLSGLAIAGALEHDFYAKPASAILAGHPNLMYVMTLCVLGLEWFGPVLLFSPIFTPSIRMLVVAALASMHIGIEIFLMIGMFSWVSMIGLTLFLPTEFWESRFMPGWVRNVTHGEGRENVEPFENKRAGKREFVIHGICFLLLLYVFAVNINGLPSEPLAPLSFERWEFLWNGLALGQRWSMFEGVPENDGWYIAHATLKDGSRVDLLRNGAKVTADRPAYPITLYRNNRWQKIFSEMVFFDQLGFQRFRDPVSKYYCRTWNAGQPAEKQVTTFDLIFMKANDQAKNDPTAPPYVGVPLHHLDLTKS